MLKQRFRRKHFTKLSRRRPDSHMHSQVRRLASQMRQQGCPAGHRHWLPRCSQIQNSQRRQLGGCSHKGDDARGTSLAKTSLQREVLQRSEVRQRPRDGCSSSPVDGVTADVDVAQQRPPGQRRRQRCHRFQWQLCRDELELRQLWRHRYVGTATLSPQTHQWPPTHSATTTNIN